AVVATLAAPGAARTPFAEPAGRISSGHVVLPAALATGAAARRRGACLVPAGARALCLPAAEHRAGPADVAQQRRDAGAGTAAGPGDPERATAGPGDRELRQQPRRQSAGVATRCLLCGPVALVR